MIKCLFIMSSDILQLTMPALMKPAMPILNGKT
nr:MAG TPA: hypothetical protein [Caudoviricetes sp.]